MGREHEPAVQALYARRAVARVELWHEQALALPEAFVINFEALLRPLQLDGAGQLFVGVRGERAAEDEGIAKALGVRLGDESARGGREGQDAHNFEDLQLVRRAPGAVDVEVVAHRIDLLEGKVSQYAVEDLRQAEALLAAHHEARNGLPIQDRLAPLRGRTG